MNTKVLLPLLKGLPTYALNEPNEQQQMTRQENKFLIAAEYLPELLVKLLPHYRLLCIKNQCLHDYHNVYFDTDELTFFHQHHNQHRLRKKVRLRSYLNTQSHYFEIKQKLKRGVSHKERILSNGDINSVLKQGQALLKRYDLADLILLPTLQVDYQRLSLWHEQTNERITFDMNTHFKSCDDPASYYQERRVIIEIKHHERPHQSHASKLFKQLGLRETAFSKYCMGLLFTHRKAIKYNYFKALLLNDEKYSQQQVLPCWI